MTRGLADALLLAEPGVSRWSFDTSVAHPARVYDYWLGGKDHFAADRAAGAAAAEANPAILARRAGQPPVPRPGRAVPGSDAGIRQFLDIGTGLPSADNTHEVAQAAAPESPGRLRGQRPHRAGARPRAC